MSKDAKGKDDKAADAKVTVEIPIGRPYSDKVQRHLEARLNEAEAQALELVRAGLAERPRRFASTFAGHPGRVVDHTCGADVMRWILQQIWEQSKTA